MGSLEIKRKILDIFLKCWRNEKHYFLLTVNMANVCSLGFCRAMCLVALHLLALLVLVLL